MWKTSQNQGVIFNSVCNETEIFTYQSYEDEYPPGYEIVDTGMAMAEKFRKAEDSLLRLHQEIIDFELEMAGTPQDNVIRNKVISRVSTVVDYLWPGSRVELFGSFRTGLHLPGSSDIDLAIIRNTTTGQRGCNQKYTDLRDALIKFEVADAHSIVIVDKTMVPLVKLTDKWTDVKVDIIFQENSGTMGVQTAAFIKKICQEFPELSKLVFVIKQLMLQNDKNEVYKGGISSYSLILMLYSMFKAHRVSNTVCVNDPLGLGKWLILFFGFYGSLNFDQYGIQVKELWPYFERPQYMSPYGEFQAPLSIVDPLTPGNDIGRGSYGIKIVQAIFASAYKELSTAILSKVDDSTRFLDVIFKNPGRRTRPLAHKRDDMVMGCVI